MSDQQSQPEGLTERVRRLAELLRETGLLRLRIERAGEAYEVGGPARASSPSVPTVAAEAPAPRTLETIRADLVGIVHFGRPAPGQGERLEGDRELAYIEALGIRNPVRVRGGGRIAAVLCRDGAAVEYGQPLFEVDRG